MVHTWSCRCSGCSHYPTLTKPMPLQSVHRVICPTKPFYLCSCSCQSCLLLGVVLAVKCWRYISLSLSQTGLTLAPASVVRVALSNDDDGGGGGGNDGVLKTNQPLAPSSCRLARSIDWVGLLQIPPLQEDTAHAAGAALVPPFAPPSCATAAASPIEEGAPLQVEGRRAALPHRSAAL